MACDRIDCNMATKRKANQPAAQARMPLTLLALRAGSLPSRHTTALLLPTLDHLRRPRLVRRGRIALEILHPAIVGFEPLLDELAVEGPAAQELVETELALDAVQPGDAVQLETENAQTLIKPLLVALRRQLGVLALRTEDVDDLVIVRPRLRVAAVLDHGGAGALIDIFLLGLDFRPAHAWLPL